jgi:hypothetical protein
VADSVKSPPSARNARNVGTVRLPSALKLTGPETNVDPVTAIALRMASWSRAAPDGPGRRAEDRPYVLVRSASDLGHNLGLRVVADGVEDVRTLLRLREMSCDYAQGYALSHPMPSGRLPDACRRAQQVVLEAIAVVPALT